MPRRLPVCAARASRGALQAGPWSDPRAARCALNSTGRTGMTRSGIRRDDPPAPWTSSQTHLSVAQPRLTSVRLRPRRLADNGLMVTGHGFQRMTATSPRCCQRGRSKHVLLSWPYSEAPCTRPTASRWERPAVGAATGSSLPPLGAEAFAISAARLVGGRPWAGGVAGGAGLVAVAAQPELCVCRADARVRTPSVAVSGWKKPGSIAA